MYRSVVCTEACQGETEFVPVRLHNHANHTFRATGITAYLKNKGTLEAAQHIANHESPGPGSFTTGAKMRFRLMKSSGLLFEGSYGPEFSRLVNEAADIAASGRRAATIPE